MIDAIQNNNVLLPGLTTRGIQRIPATAGESGRADVPAVSFSNILQEAVTNAMVTDTGHRTETTNLITGQESDLHTLPIAAQQAELMLNLTVQIRNRMVESYQEIMRMQI